MIAGKRVAPLVLAALAGAIMCAGQSLPYERSTATRSSTAAADTRPTAGTQSAPAFMPLILGGAARARAKLAAVKTDLASIGVALDSFEVDCGRYPTSEEGLGALLLPPPNLAGWKGPYFQRMPTDPWGHTYGYVCPGKKNKDGYDVWSLGPDGVIGGGDDIDNWTHD